MKSLPGSRFVYSDESNPGWFLKSWWCSSGNPHHCFLQEDEEILNGINLDRFWLVVPGLPAPVSAVAGAVPAVGAHLLLGQADGRDEVLQALVCEGGKAQAFADDLDHGQVLF